MHHSPNFAAFQRWFPSALMPGDKEQHSVASRNRPFERAVDRQPGVIETMTVEVEDPVGLDPSGTEAPIPLPVERRLVKVFDPFRR